MDVSVLRRDDGSEVWRGESYLHMSEITPMNSPFVSDEEQRNRQQITEIMERQGFMHYPGEFWHYNKGDAGDHILHGKSEPARYGPVDWDPATNQVTPVADPMTPLNPLPAIQREIAAAMQRL